MITRTVRLTLLASAVAFSTLSAQEPQSFGAGVSLKNTTPLATVIDRPADFEGRTVRVEGVVTAVCMHMGCWMALTPDTASAGKAMLIKVDDGVIVFPPTSKGRRAVAQGVVERVGSSREGQEAATEHARSSGAASTPAAWQLKATGALVYEKQ